MAWQPDYVTAAEMKHYAHISDTDDDAEVAWAVTTASRAVDRHTHRQFGLVAAPEARYYTARYHRRLGRWVVDIDDLMTSTGLEVMADLSDTGTYTDELDELAMRPVNAAPEGRPWTRLVVLPDSANQPRANDAGVEVTARFGWTEVPVAVEQATLLQGSRFLSRRDSPYGVAGSPETGSELRLLAKLDADVAVTLSSYIRWGAG
jgi:hypothetical protein